MKILPAIDIRNGNVVRLTQGRATESTTYDAHPTAVARRWASEGAAMLHVVDLDGAFGEGGQFDVIQDLTESVAIPIEVGGGIRTIETADRYVRMGVARVIFGTAATQDSGVIAEALKQWPDKVVIALDAKDGFVRVGGWSHDTNRRVVDVLVSLADLGVTRIQFTDIARDGMLAGPNLQSIREVATAWASFMTVGGGVSSVDDVRRLRSMARDHAGCDEIIVGKALYEGRITLRELQQQ